MIVKELIERLEKCNPEAEVKVYFEDRIMSVMEIGGNSFLTNDVRIIHSGTYGH